MNTADEIMGMIATEAVEAGSEQRLARRAADTETTRQERRWWVVDYRHTTKAPKWWRLREVHDPKEVDPLVEAWTKRGCDVRVVEVVEVVNRTLTYGQPETSSPSAELRDRPVSGAHETEKGN